ncbi:hypothetical protein OPKNFCMD_1548 [Methylobacterium crusticola]|uniref:Anti-sigma factor NepR domain-containing protein n=1 Tax=Methylobacterium crusticola TaxID=1697972 RepID=A0ABQ4QU11_9HYPH|nr:NepR family anti-sigma factor [Methylobacterium crusticola]GJD48822.1 hypothetical protein OPKNFCMD_1548 [Methylobacterium crusticola]
MIDSKGMPGPRAPQDQPPASEPDQPALDRNVQGRIGSHLRAMYDDLMQQPIPDRFIDLLANLERAADKPSETSPKTS